MYRDRATPVSEVRAETSEQYYRDESVLKLHLLAKKSPVRDIQHSRFIVRSWPFYR